MQITVNGQTETAPEALTVADLVRSKGISSQPCAVEVNKKLVPKRQHETHILAESDVVEIVTLVGGG
ncbi:MAG: sulfur carrier protein ThiS [Phycisphaerales bacterium]|jgi:sulfur carrier protein